jgi:hypothetical protein
MVKQKATTKKKGPKGKKARAKAKLDKQWGETAIIDDEKPRRLGKSRLKTRSRTQDTGKSIRWAATEGKEQEDPQEAEFHDDRTAGPQSTRLGSKQQSSLRKGRISQYNVLSDSEGGESEDEESPALQGLLDAIRKAKKASTVGVSKKKGTLQENPNLMLQDEQGSDVEMEDDDSLDSESDDSELEDSDGDDDADEESVQEHIDDEHQTDLFYKHFHREPLSQEQLQNLSLTSHKIKVDSKTELHVVTDPSAEEESPFNSNTSLDNLRQLAISSFEANRKVLKTRWMKLSTTVMMESQASIYPFLTRYMDMLITTESRKVCLASTICGILGSNNSQTLPVST